ncbi:MAG: dodecin family protein [Parvibaculaceae bacterium]
MDNVYRITEVVGSSTESQDDAIRRAVEAASKTIRNLDWFEVGETRGHIENGKIAHYQVVVRIGFRVDTEEA